MATFIDLFAGCGGFSAGLRHAGFKALAEVEFDTWACDTLRANFADSDVIEADIRTISDSHIAKYAGADLMVGGPPCQGFSVAGSTQFGMADPRNELFYWFLHWVELLQPKIAIIENVPSILSKVQRGSTVIDAVRDRLGRLGYEVAAQIINAADFGAPQARRRAFIVASAPGVRFTITDNGIGFTPENLRSFETSDSRFKYQRGGKGVGRFIWIKMFDTIKVESIVRKGRSSERIRFRFAPEKPSSIASKRVAPVHATETGTTITRPMRGHLFSNESPCSRSIPSSRMRTVKGFIRPDK